MRLLFVIQGLQSGGAERVMSVLCNSFSEKGHEVLLGLTERTDVIAYGLNPNIKILDLRCQCGNTISFFLKSAGNIRTAIDRYKPEVVISFITRANICSILGSLGKNVPVIVSERNNPTIDPPSKITRTIRRLIYPLAKGYVFQTNYAKEYFCKSIQKRGTVIYNPIDDKIFQLPLRERQKRVIAVGRLEPQKNFSLLINAFAEAQLKHPDYILDIYGEGSLKDKLQEQIIKGGLYNIVHLKGHTDNTFDELASSRIFALSSNYEGMPNALMEAMCMGCACVSTDAPAYGARELINDGVSGYLVPIGDKNVLVEKLSFLMGNENLQKMMSIEAIKVREKVKSEIIVNKWLDYINKVIQR
jgi:glycosyltransferase involved in cell wall biosynthesis